MRRRRSRRKERSGTNPALLDGEQQVVGGNRQRDLLPESPATSLRQEESADSGNQGEWRPQRLRNSDGGNSEHSGDSSRPDDAQAEATNESNLVELTSAASSDSAGEQQSMDVNGREPRRAALFAVGGKLGTLPATTGSPRPSASSVSEDDSGAELHSAIEAAQNPLPRDLQLRARSRILNEQHLGSIVDVRYNPERQQFEYYIHFDGWNKRLDEWLSVEDLDLSDLPQRIAEHTRRARERQERRRSRTSNTPSVGKRQVKTETATSVENEHDSASLQTPSMAAERGRSTNVSSDVMTRVKNLHSIVIGRWEIETWYYSPLPPEFCNLRTLYICEFTLKFFRSRDGLARHLARNTRWHPPGQEIYRKENLAVFQVDGARNRFYCQNVCYLSKLFLDHKTLYYDVDPFWFYILCELDSYGYHFVGYFSKEKASEEHYNVACILTLPPYQRKGYGKFLIALSYELSRREGIRGSPEKPLSDLGLLGYRSYWSQVLIDLLTEAKAPLSIEEIADRTMMKTEDIIGTLRALDLVHYHEGQHIIDLRRVQHMRLGHRGMPFDPACLRWSPPVGRKRRIN